MNPLDNIRVVLVETSHPGNIGAAARAMKTMGLSDLCLVNPDEFPHPDAVHRASGADDLLEAARVAPSLEAALAECHWVIGSSARPRKLAWPTLTPREAGERCIQETGKGKVALVFGRERTGLTNGELDLCHAVVTIPTSEAYASLNLGAAVQLICYELRVAAQDGVMLDVPPPEAPPATHDEIERMYAHFQSVLGAREFLDPQNPQHLMRRLRRLFGRVQLDRNEVQILRGMLATLAPDVKPGNPESSGNT